MRTYEVWIEVAEFDTDTGKYNNETSKHLSIDEFRTLDKAMNLARIISNLYEDIKNI
jgi:hypothetical protein